MCAGGKGKSWKRAATAPIYKNKSQDMTTLPEFRYANNGLLEPFMDFKVDNFYRNKHSTRTTYFLSHMHEGKYFMTLTIQRSSQGFDSIVREWLPSPR